MRDEMARKLSEYFSKKGTDRSAYVSDPEAPYHYRDVVRVFKNFALAIAAASAVNASDSVVEESINASTDEISADVDVDINTDFGGMDA